MVGQQLGLEALRAVALAILGAQEGLVAHVHKCVLPWVTRLQEGFATLSALVLVPLPWGACW